MAARYFNGEVTEQTEANTDPFDARICESFAGLAPLVDARLEDLQFSRALDVIWIALDKANKHIVATAPFSLAKDPANMPRVAEILASLLEGLRVVADVLEPFMPGTSRRMFDMLAVDGKTARAPFGEGIRKGHRVNPPVPLFPRIEKPKPQ